ncbi:MAG TPA: ferrous iron transport protein B [Ignavibacteriaceae bacterium]|nr:ferrous iron transport protein B [Ignavibacteriaceae bacterium]
MTPTSEMVDTLPLITLVGSPNSGKTTLFNYLSGKHYKTVNYPGSTVDYSIAKVMDKFGIRANLLDSPGIISLIPVSPDEKVSIESIYNHPVYGSPELLVVSIDASQLSRHLLLAKQLIQSNFKIIVALTMNDLLSKKGKEISTKQLENELGCPCVKIDSRNGDGISELLKVLKHNLKDVLLMGKNDPLPYLVTEKHSLVEIFKEIGEIENKVLIEKVPDKKLNHANQQLNKIKNNRNNLDHHSMKIDSILLHRFWGIIIFFLIMAATFTSIFWVSQPLMDIVDSFFAFLSEGAVILLGNNWFGDLISNGLISGTGSVLVFVPQILILFLILGVLEDSGYLARGAMLIDKPLSKIGLNGKSFVPMLSGFACAIPATMAARTIPNRKERLLTIFIIPLMSCSARLPVYALLISFITPRDSQWIGGLILAGIYIFGITSSVVIAAIVNKFKDKFIKEEDNSSFILELPVYRMPKLSVIVNNTLNNAKHYVRRAGPTILILSLVIWFLSYFPNYNPQVNETGKTVDEIVQLQQADRLSSSYASQIGKFIQPVMEPIGMDWRVGVSLISAFAAREVFVSSLAMIFKVTGDGDNLQQSILSAMKNAKIEGTNQDLFTMATILGLIVFFIFALQCISTIAISRKETGGWRIPMLQLIVFTSTAYIMTFITVNGLRFLGIN